MESPVWIMRWDLILNDLPKSKYADQFLIYLTVADPTGTEAAYTTAKAVLSEYFDPSKNRA